MNGTGEFMEFTVREGQILFLLANAWTNAHIAEKLQISPNTVRTHIRALKVRVGARNRTHLAVIAIRHGFGIRTGYENFRGTNIAAGPAQAESLPSPASGAGGVEKQPLMRSEHRRA